MAALFGNAGGRSQSKNLVEFRAGKMVMKGKMVHPDKRKGQVYVHQTDDALMHFCWKDRTSGSVEEDLIIFPEDVEFRHVPQCTTGRVYVLKFKSSQRRLFFWMQEPKSDRDTEYCKKVNDSLNNPPTPGSSRGSGLPSDLSGLGDSDLQSMLGGMNQQQLMQLLGGMGMGGPGSNLSSLMGRSGSAQSTASEPPLRASSASGNRSSLEATPTPRPMTSAGLLNPASGGGTTTTTTTTTAAAPGSNTGTISSATPASRPQQQQQQQQHIQLSDLQNILSSMNVPTEPKEAVDLSKALTPEVLLPLLSHPQIQRRLMPLLPDSQHLPKNEEELRATMSSPQFQQALTSFSQALQSGQLGPLMTQFGFGEDVANAAAQGDMEAFVKALQEAMKNKDQDKGDNGGEEMDH